MLVAVGIGALLLGCVMLLQVPRVQTAIARALLDKLSNNIEGRITVGSINILPVNTLILKDICITDNSPAAIGPTQGQDTILHISSLIAYFDRKGISGKPYNIKKLTLDGVSGFLSVERPGSNYKRVFKIKGGDGLRDNGDVVHLKNLNARNLHFRLLDALASSRDSIPQGIDFRDLDLDIPILKGSDIGYRDGHIVFDVDECSLTDKSGYQIAALSGSVDIQKGKVSISNMAYQDNWSTLDVPLYEMTIPSRTIADRSPIQYNITARGSHLDGQSISYLTGRAGRFTPGLDISALEAHGSVKDLEISRLGVTEESGVRLSLSGRLKNLDDLPQASADINLQHLVATSSSLQDLLRKCSVSVPVNLREYATGCPLNLRARCKGPANALKMDASLDAGTLGRLICELKVGGLVQSNSPVRVEGILESTDLDIGSILGNDVVHGLSARAYLRSQLGGKHPSAIIDSLSVSRLNLLGYDYSPLAATGKFSDSAFDGRIICSDPNLNFLFQGLFNLSGKTNNALYKFYLNLGYADLHALGIDGREISRASGTVNANYMRIRSGEILGDVDLSRVLLESADGRYDLGTVSLSSSYADNTHKISLKSDFLKGSFVSDSNPLDAISILKGATIGQALPALCKDDDLGKDGTLDLDFTFTDMHKLLSFFKPGAYIANGSAAGLHVGRDGNLKASVQSQRIAIKDKYIKDLDIAINSGPSDLSLNAGSSEIKLGGPFLLLGSTIKALARQDHIDASAAWHNDSDSFGKILAGADLSRGSDEHVALAAYTLPSQISSNGTIWDIDASNLSLGRGDLSVEGLRIHSGEESLAVDGRLCRSDSDSLMLTLRNLDMALAGALTGLNLGGALSGEARVQSPYSDNLAINASLKADSTTISGLDAGNMLINAGWDKLGQLLTFTLDSELEGLRNLGCYGSLNTAEDLLDARVEMDRLQLGYLSDLIPGISGIGGTVSGDLRLSGPPGEPDITADGTRLDDATLHVDYTGVTYHLDGPLSIDNQRISLDNVSLSDGERGSGRVSGGLAHNKLKNMKAAMQLDFSDMLVFDIDDVSEDVYGHVAADGTIHLSGPLDDLDISCNARNAGGSDIHVLLKSGTVSSTNLLTFKQPQVWEDPYERMLRGLRTNRTKTNNIDIKVHLEPDQEMEINLDLDRSNGNAVTARGEGAVDVAIAPVKNETSVTGDYNISSGNVHFSALGIATRDFAIKDGSSLKFNGDIQDSDLDIDASYVTKTSLANLIADTTSVSTRRTVECGINISDKMRNPKLKFSIDIPDLDPTMASSVRNALNTEDKLQRQFLSLLVTNSFLPTDQSGIVNNSNMLYSNVSEIMAGQLNNILQRLDIPLDLGLKYQPGQDGTDIFDVAVSTQLFNNRVTVNGNIGNRQDGVTQASGDVAGDLDIDIKLDKAGAVRMSLFSHSADIYSNYLDNLQRNGVGIGYQKEFRNLRQLWREIFHPRKKDDKAEEAKVTIKIDEQD